MSSATWCTSRTSPASTTNDTLVRVWLRTKWWCTELNNSSDGIGACSASESRSERIRKLTPSSIAASTSRKISPSLRSRPAPPSPTRYKPRTVREQKMPRKDGSASTWMILASSSLSITGKSRINLRACSGAASRRLGSGPMAPAMDVTSSSRIASSGGLVTWANICLK